MTHGTIEHEMYLRARKDLIRNIESSSPGQIVWLIAPSGSGKSEIRYHVMRTLAGDPRSWGEGRIPAVSIRVTLTDRNRFNPKDLAMRLAMSLRSPNLSWLTPRGLASSPDIVHFQQEVLASSQQWAGLRTATTEHALRSEFELSAPVRGVKWVFLEEVASLLQVRRNQSARNYMTGLMQMAEEIGCVLVMIGTHMAQDLWHGNQEVLNRSRWTWVFRYNDQCEDHHRHFASMVKAIGSRYRLSSRDLLLKNLDLALLNGAGVFGSTLQFIDRADAERDRHGEEVISEVHLRAACSTLEEQKWLWGQVRDFDHLANRKRSDQLQSVCVPAWGCR